MSSDPWQRWLGPLLSADDGADAEWMSQFTLTALGQASRWRALPPVRGALEATAKALPRRSCLLYTSPSPRDATLTRMPSSA